MAKYYYDNLSIEIGKNDFLAEVEAYAEKNKVQVYVVSSPLIDKRNNVAANVGYVILQSKKRIMFVHHSGSEDDFKDYVDDIKEDISFISKKYDTENIIGRKRSWSDKLFFECAYSKGARFEDIVEKNLSIDKSEWRKIDIMISLFIGCINDSSKIMLDEPDDLLDKIRYKIQLFDTDQTRFIYEVVDKKIVRIQGLAGTGKTELLLHKIKDLYLSDPESKIVLTCHNHVLANSLRTRLPQFFNSMKVDKQIEWDQRLWCFNAWGRTNQNNSGMLRLICAYYDLPFLSLREAGDFNQACKLTIKELKSRGIANTRHMVDYVFIDESQDFEDSFIELCSMVTNKRVYVAGDIFQSIFEEHIVDAHNTDFLLSRCYRTDPKTLMFAQGLGMGLFESKKLYWLEKEKWELCGYSVVENTQQNIYTLSREPIRRFEDLSPNYVSLDIKETNDLCSTVIATLNELKNENPSIQPSDVCIIFLDTENYVYEYASKLGFIIEDKIGWDYILAHETKDITSERLVITNRNNIKGLEFPFVFCITKKIIRDHNYRNTIYTMLSRSFLRSYLIVQKDDDNGLTEEMKKGAENILKNKNMVVKIPTKEEIKEIKQDFGIQHQSKSLRERIETLMRKYDIPIDKIDYVVENVQTLPNKAPNDDQLEKLISALKGLV